MNKQEPTNLNQNTNPMNQNTNPNPMNLEYMVELSDDECASVLGGADAATHAAIEGYGAILDVNGEVFGGDTDLDFSGGVDLGKLKVR